MNVPTLARLHVSEKPAIIVASIGNYTITDQELEKRLLTEIRPNNYGNYNEEPEPVKTDKVLLKMIAEKAVVSEARKGDYLKDESLSSIIKINGLFLSMISSPLMNLYVDLSKD